MLTLLMVGKNTPKIISGLTLAKKSSFHKNFSLQSISNIKKVEITIS